VGVDLSACPFCGGDVDRDLIRFGGPCPRCFAEIPGEEAPTDPGEEVRSAQAAKDRRRSTVRALVPIVLAAPVVAVLALIGLYLVLRPPPEVAVLDFDDYDYPMPELVGRVDEAPPTEAVEVAKGERPRNSGADRKGSVEDRMNKLAAAGKIDGGSGTPQLEAGVGSAGRPGMGTRGPRGLDAPSAADPELKATGSRRAGVDFGITEVTQSRRGGVYRDPDQKRKMIADAMAVQVPRLNACYERRLKTAPDLTGRWRVKFLITQAGGVQQAGAVGLETNDGEFEACLSRELGKWKFDRIDQDQPVQRTLRFRPSY
jgi:hypothetical protein